MASLSAVIGFDLGAFPNQSQVTSQQAVGNCNTPGCHSYPGHMGLAPLCRLEMTPKSNTLRCRYGGTTQFLPAREGPFVRGGLLSHTVLDQLMSETERRNRHRDSHATNAHNGTYVLMVGLRGQVGSSR